MAERDPEPTGLSCLLPKHWPVPVRLRTTILNLGLDKLGSPESLYQHRRRRDEAPRLIGMHAVLYSRESTPAQIEASEARQFRSNMDYAARLKVVLVDKYADLGISGKQIKGRSGIEALMRDAKTGTFNMVIVESISRLARDLVDALKIFKHLQALGIELHESTGGKVERISLGIKAYVAEHEHGSFKAISSEAKARAARRGKTMTKVGYGYVKCPLAAGGYEKHSHDAGIVRWLYEQAADGVPVVRLAHELTERGEAVPTKGRPGRTAGNERWHSGVIASMLRHPIYGGLVVYGRTAVQHSKTDYNDTKVSAVSPDLWIKNYHHGLAVVEPALWLKVQEILERGAFWSKTTPKQPIVHVFEGKLYCARCNVLLKTRTSKMYWCAGVRCSKEKRRDPQRVRHRLAAIESAAFLALADALKTESMREAVARSATPRTAPATGSETACDVEERRRELNRDLRRIESRITEEWEALFEAGWEAADDRAHVRGRLENEVDAIRADLLALPSAPTGDEAEAESLLKMLRSHDSMEPFVPRNEGEKSLVRLLQGFVRRIDLSVEEGRLVVRVRLAEHLAASLPVPQFDILAFDLDPEEARRVAIELSDDSLDHPLQLYDGSRAALDEALQQSRADWGREPQELAALARLTGGASCLDVGRSLMVDERLVLAWLHIYRTHGARYAAERSGRCAQEWQEEAARDIEQAARRMHRAKLRQLMAVAEFLRGRSFEAIAAAENVDLMRVMTWLLRFERGGCDGRLNMAKYEALTPDRLDRIKRAVEEGRHGENGGRRIGFEAIADLCRTEFSIDVPAGKLANVLYSREVKIGSAKSRPDTPWLTIARNLAREMEVGKMKAEDGSA